MADAFEHPIRLGKCRQRLFEILAGQPFRRAPQCLSQCCVRNPDRIAELGRFQTQQRYTVDDNGQATLAYFAGQAISGVIVQPRGGGIHALCGNAFAAMIGLVASADSGERLAQRVTSTSAERRVWTNFVFSYYSRL